jgi:hypothetical protein
MNPAYVLLPLILYIGGYFLDLKDIKKNSVPILLSISIGVASKILFVGLILQSVVPGPLSWVVACVIGQIDPGATIFFRRMRPQQIGDDYKTISGAMSSFDDPCTVLISLFILPFALTLPFQFEINYFVGNVIIVLGLVGFSFIVSERVKFVIVTCFLLLSSFIKSTVGAAVLGVCIKPKIIVGTHTFEHLVHRLVPILFFITFVCVLFSLKIVPTTFEIYFGVSAALLIFLSQIVTGQWIGRYAKLPVYERWLFSFDQFNGITSSTLALFFAPLFPQIIPITVVAIVTVGIIYLMVNWTYKNMFSYIAL